MGGGFTLVIAPPSRDNNLSLDRDGAYEVLQIAETRNRVTLEDNLKL